MAAPDKLGLYANIDFSARASTLNAVATMVNNWNTYWLSVTAQAKVIDPSCGDIMSAYTRDLNSIIVCVNSMNTEFTLGATPTPVTPNGATIDFNNFQQILNQIIAQMVAMQTAKP
jgi:hypothetical protein